jgi:uncharacterized protein YerC
MENLTKIKMAKVKVYSINKEEKLRIIGDFFDVVAALKTHKEVAQFFTGFLTASEALMMARRIQIIRMLLEEVPKEVIRKKLRVSHQNVDRIEHWLRGDDEKEKIIKGKIRKPNKSSKTKCSNLLDRYAYHRFLKELLS